MMVRILFSQDKRGFVERRYEVPVEVVRDMFSTYRETRNLNRAIDIVCRYVAETAAEEWCEKMGMRGNDECIIGYIDKQGERIMEQCELAVKAWLVNVYECVKEDKLSSECFNAPTRG